MRNRVTKIVVSYVIFWCLLLFTACGTGDDESTTATVESDYFDIETTEKEIGSPTEADSNWRLLSTQFYQGEPIQIWSVKKDTVDGISSWDVYLYHEDESKEILVNGISSEYLKGGWFLDGDGNIYIRADGRLTRMTGDGTILYSEPMDNEIRDICRLSDGRVMLLVKTEDGIWKLAELNPEDGTVTEKNNIILGEHAQQFINEGVDGLVLLDGDGLWSIDLSSGKKEQLMKFAGSSYELNGAVSDFLAAEQNKVQILYNGKVETLQLTNVTKTKTVIVVRDWKFDATMKDYVARFNRENEIYSVKLEQCEKNTSTMDFYTETNVEIATGGGADIICGGAMMDIASLMEKGAFVDLKPYMENSGINEEDYFPVAFDGWKDGEKIYGVNMYANILGLWVDESLVGSDGMTDIESLVEALLKNQEAALFKGDWEADWLLDYFLAGTSDLWGMIDWGNSSCDFDNELFSKMLMAAKQYGYDEKKEGYPVLADFALNHTFYVYDTAAKLQSEGKHKIGYIFEDGCYMGISPYDLMAINVNSPNKEGAWEFISFLISESVQSSMEYLEGYPVNIKAFETMAEREIAEGAVNTDLGGGRFKAGDAAYADVNGIEAYRELYDLTPDKVAEIRGVMEQARSLPINTEPIRTIILEEAVQYFNGTKTIEEIIPIIENRVQLYLDEQN